MASRVLTIVFSAGAVVVLLVAIFARGCGGDGGEVGNPTGYRVMTAPFPAGTVSGVLVISSGSAARLVPAATASGCEARATPAVVWIEGPRAGGAPRENGATLRLGTCGFDERAAVAMAGDPVDVRAGSRDHRFQAWMDRVRVFDAAQPGDATISLVAAGRWQVRCAAGHPGEEAWVVATRNPYARVIEPDGSFSLASVPAGTWTIVGWHPAIGETRSKITVTPEATTRVELAL